MTLMTTMMSWMTISATMALKKLQRVRLSPKKKVQMMKNTIVRRVIHHRQSKLPPKSSPQNLKLSRILIQMRKKQTRSISRKRKIVRTVTKWAKT